MDHSIMLRDCQPEDPKGRPYKIERTSKMGRIVTATRDIARGELIFSEKPLNRGPRMSGKPVCLGCYRVLKGGEVLCPKGCGWPVCSQSCSALKYEHKSECDFFKKKKIKVEAAAFKYGEVEEMYDIISPLRVMLAKEEDAKIFFDMESHLEDRRKDGGWVESHKFITEYFKNKLGFKDLEKVLTIFGVFATNDFSVQTSPPNTVMDQARAEIRLCYPLVAMCAHDCTPNTFRCIDGRAERGGDGFAQEVRARADIKRGESVTISYVDTVLPTPVRRATLLRDKRFRCECRRCRHRTELGSYCNALMCESYCQGAIVPEKDGDDKVWKCEKCGEKKGEEEVISIMEEIHGEMSNLISDVTLWTPDDYEAFLLKHVERLHPHNGLLISIKSRLCGMYGRCQGYEVPYLNEFHLMRKLQLAKESMEVLNITEPGIGTIKGMVEYEMHLPFIMLSQMYVQIGKISLEASAKDFKRGLEHLKNSLEHLKYDAEGSFAKAIYHGAVESVAGLEAYVVRMFEE